MIANSINFEPMEGHLLLHLVPSCAVSTQTELASAVAVDPAHSEVGSCREADEAAASAKELAPDEFVACRAARQSPASRLALHLQKSNWIASGYD